MGKLRGFMEYRINEPVVVPDDNSELQRIYNCPKK